MFKIDGLDRLQRELAEAERAIAEIDGELGAVSFDPHSPESISAAIVSAEQLIDERLGQYADNSVVGPMISQMKESCRTAIIDRAAEARLTDNITDGE